MFLTALLFSLIFKKADLSEGDEEDEEEIFLQPDEEWMHPMPGDPGNGESEDVLLDRWILWMIHVMGIFQVFIG